MKKSFFLPKERLLVFILEWRNTTFLKNEDFLPSNPLKNTDFILVKN